VADITQAGSRAISAIPEKTGIPVTVDHAADIQAMIEPLFGCGQCRRRHHGHHRTAPALNQAI
jgi:hypothetical protein